MISTSNLWAYGLPSLVVILLCGLILPFSVPHGPGVHRAPRGYAPEPTPSLGPFRPMTDGEIEEFEREFLTTAARLSVPIETPGATLEEGGIGDAVRVPATVATLDPDPDSPEAWLARWHAEYSPEPITGELEMRSDEEILTAIVEIELAMRSVADDLITAILTPAEVGAFLWRVETDTTEIPRIT